MRLISVFFAVAVPLSYLPLAPVLLIAASLPAAGSDAGLYQQLEAADFMREKFTAKRTPTGIDFESKERVLTEGRSHPKFHIEIEGPLPVDGATSLESALERVAAVVAPEVDRTHPEKNSTYPGLGVDLVDLNGVNVAFLQYKNAREPDTFCRRAVIYTNKHIYVATMSLHG